MADEFDPCECVWSHEHAMRRLLSWLRQSQSYCTDTECIDLPNITSPSQNAESGNFMFMSVILIFAVILYMLRPNGMRRTTELQKPRPPFDGEGPNNNGAPPPPPSVD